MPEIEVTPKDIAQETGLNVQVVRRYLRDMITPTRDGVRWGFTRAEADRLIEAIKRKRDRQRPLKGGGI